MRFQFACWRKPGRRRGGWRKRNCGPGKQNSNRRGMRKWYDGENAQGGNDWSDKAVFTEVPMTAKMSLRTIAVIDANKCTGCALCEMACRRQAIHMNGDGVAVVDKEKCTGCGLCVNECPGVAISLLTGV